MKVGISRTVRLLSLGFAAAASIALTAGAASAAPASAPRQIASCRAQGDFAICDAVGDARHQPVTIVVHVRATPRQGVSVAWDITCSKGLGAGGSSGQFNSGTPVNRKLHHPYAHPDSCIVSADAQLSRGGHVHLWLTYRS
jgi:hypothetical protein